MRQCGSGAGGWWHHRVGRRRSARVLLRQTRSEHSDPRWGAGGLVRWAMSAVERVRSESQCPPIHVGGNIHRSMHMPPSAVEYIASSASVIHTRSSYVECEFLCKYMHVSVCVCFGTWSRMNIVWVVSNVSI